MVNKEELLKEGIKTEGSLSLNVLNEFNMASICIEEEGKGFMKDIDFLSNDFEKMKIASKILKKLEEQAKDKKYLLVESKFEKGKIVFKWEEILKTRTYEKELNENSAFNIKKTMV